MILPESSGSWTCPINSCPQLLKEPLFPVALHAASRVFWSSARCPFWRCIRNSIRGASMASKDGTFFLQWFVTPFCASKICLKNDEKTWYNCWCKFMAFKYIWMEFQANIGHFMSFHVISVCLRKLAVSTPIFRSQLRPSTSKVNQETVRSRSKRMDRIWKWLEKEAESSGWYSFSGPKAPVVSAGSRLFVGFLAKYPPFNQAD